MDRISGLSDELLVKILSLVPTKVSVSTSVLSKRWESLWMYVPNLEFVNNHYNSGPAIRDFINKNLPLLRAPAVESFRLECSLLECQPGDVTRWLASTVSRCLRELEIDSSYFGAACLPSRLYTCESLVTLKLRGGHILVDVPRNVSLPSLKTLVLGEGVKYRSKDCFRLLISYCPVLEDLVVDRSCEDNLETIVVISKSLQRLTLPIGGARSEEYVIVTPSLKYFKVFDDYNLVYSYFVAHMPNLEEADLCVEDDVQNLLDHVTSVKRLSLRVSYDFLERYMYDDDIFFSRLEHLKLCIRFDNWSKLLFRLLHDSPNLKVLNLEVSSSGRFKKYVPVNWNDGQISVPSCLLESLETLEFAEYRGSQEERDFVSFIIKNACRLKSSTIKPCTYIETFSSSESNDD